MKIHPDMTIGSVAGTQAKTQAGAKGAFEDVLKGLETDSAAKASVTGAQFQAFSVSPQKLSALSAGEEAIELLDSYAKAVSDPGVTLKTLSSKVDELDAMRLKVENAASFIADNDPLKGIMNEVSSTLYGEVLRFRRGELIG
jgi:flagellin-like hook-associated protein FlgL